VVVTLEISRVAGGFMIRFVGHCPSGLDPGNFWSEPSSAAGQDQLSMVVAQFFVRSFAIDGAV
jgi:hypothetical protein